MRTETRPIDTLPGSYNIESVDDREFSAPQRTYCIEIHHKTSWVDNRSCNHYLELGNYRFLNGNQPYVERMLSLATKACSHPYRVLLDRWNSMFRCSKSHRYTRLHRSAWFLEIISINMGIETRFTSLLVPQLWSLMLQNIVFGHWHVKFEWQSRDSVLSQGKALEPNVKLLHRCQPRIFGAAMKSETDREKLFMGMNDRYTTSRSIPIRISGTWTSISEAERHGSWAEHSEEFLRDTLQVGCIRTIGCSCTRLIVRVLCHAGRSIVELRGKIAITVAWWSTDEIRQTRNNWQAARSAVRGIID